MPKIYCAGPLFNPLERQEMATIATTLEALGHTTFLPQRDGLELSRLESQLLEKGISVEDASKAIDSAIFCLDVYQLLSWSDAVVANLNGRVPDEGTVVEAALAWHAGKALVLYKRDSRAPFFGRDNPMLTGLGAFKIVTCIDDLGDALKIQLNSEHKSRKTTTTDLGARIAKARQTGDENIDLARLIKELF